MHVIDTIDVAFDGLYGGFVGCIDTSLGFGQGTRGQSQHAQYKKSFLHFNKCVSGFRGIVNDLELVMNIYQIFSVMLVIKIGRII